MGVGCAQLPTLALLLMFVVMTTGPAGSKKTRTASATPSRRDPLALRVTLEANTDAANAKLGTPVAAALSVAPG